MVLPVLVTLALAGVLAVQVGQLRLRCIDAAGQAARAMARGDPTAADRVAEQATGRSVTVVRSARGPDTAVTVRIALRPVRWLAPLVLSETAVVQTEPATGLESSGAGG